MSVLSSVEMKKKNRSETDVKCSKIVNICNGTVENKLNISRRKRDDNKKTNIFRIHSNVLTILKGVLYEMICK